MDKRPAENYVSPGSGILWGKRAHLEQKKVEISSWYLVQGLGSQEVSRASAPLQPMGLFLDTCNLQLPSQASLTTTPVPQSCAKDHIFPRLGKQADADGWVGS